MMTFIVPICQITFDGFSKASETSIVNAIMVSIVLILFGGILFLFKKLDETYAAKGDLQKEHSDVLIRLQIEYQKDLMNTMKSYNAKIEEMQAFALKREEERNKQWIESEKETLNVLNGVTSILDMAEKMDQANRHTVYLKLQEMENRITSKIEALPQKK